MNSRMLGPECVASLVHRRDCVVLQMGPLKCELVLAHADETARVAAVVAVGHNRWRAFDVLRACTELKGEAVPGFETPKGLPLTPGGLDESQIAMFMAASGVRPYWRGKRTFALRAVLSIANAETGRIPFSDNHLIRTALNALIDVGLATMVLGP